MVDPIDGPPSVVTVEARKDLMPQELRSGFRRAVGLTALGTVIPGAGLTQTKSSRLGWSILALAVTGGLVLVYFVASQGLTGAALTLVASTAILQAAAISLVAVGVAWCATIVLTAVQARPARLDRPRTRMLAGFTTVMVALVAAVSVTAAQYVAITKDTVAQVFQAAPPEPGATPAVVATAGDDPWADTPRVNILLLGSDAGVGRDGTRTDSMIVASIDTRSGNTVLISLPRNLQNVPLAPDSKLRDLYPSGVYGSPVCFRAQLHPADQCMLNAIWTEVAEYQTVHPGTWTTPVPGRAETRSSIQEIIGMKIDQTVVIDLKGFQQLIDAMGGVDINVKLSASGTRLPIGGHADGQGNITGVTGYLEPGAQHLDGYHALWYARTRAADTDGYRQARQRCVVQAVVQQVNPASMVAKYPQIAKIAKDNIYTDIPAQNLPAFVELSKRVQNGTITNVSMTPEDGINSVRPDYDKIRKLIRTAIKPPTPKASASTSTIPTPSKATTTPATPSPTTTPYSQC